MEFHKGLVICPTQITVKGFNMADIATQAPIQSGKAKAPTNGDKAKGGALAVLCITYATKRMEQEEKEAGKLASIVKSIQELARDGHAEFRAQLTAELELIKELHKVPGEAGGEKVSKVHTMGYSLNSFAVLVTNWKTISMAVELGLDTRGKPWGQVLGEAVAMKHAHASNAGEGEQLPTKRKAGRKATPLIDKAVTAAETLLENNPKDFKKFAALVAKMLDKANALTVDAPM